jgi:polar amino acid transport system substrate-binding protein
VTQRRGGPVIIEGDQWSPIIALRRGRAGAAPRGRPNGRWIIIGLVAAALLAALLWWLLRTLPPAVDPTWERILETGVLPVCTDPSWPPFEFTDEKTGRIEGFDADLARLLAARLAPGVSAQLVPVGFDSLYDALLSGRCDLVLSALPYEAMRTEDVVFSVAYFNAGLVLVTRTDPEAAGIRGLNDLVGKVVGVEWGFVPEGDSQQRQLLQGLGLRRYNTAEETLRACQSGEVEAVLVDRITALGYQRECGGLQIVGEPITNLNYIVPLRPDSFQLISEVNRVLLAMREDGTLEALQQRWF